MRAIDVCPEAESVRSNRSHVIRTGRPTRVPRTITRRTVNSSSPSGELPCVKQQPLGQLARHDFDLAHAYRLTAKETRVPEHLHSVRMTRVSERLLLEGRRADGSQQRAQTVRVERLESPDSREVDALGGH